MYALTIVEGSGMVGNYKRFLPWKIRSLNPFNVTMLHLRYNGKGV